MPTQIEIAWAAGFFDGEGCTYVQCGKRGRRSVRMGIGQTTLEPLERFHTAVSFHGRIYGPYQRGNKKQVWEWRASTEDALSVAAILFDFLCSPKQEQLLEKIQESEDDLAERMCVNPRSLAQRGIHA